MRGCIADARQLWKWNQIQRFPVQILFQWTLQIRYLFDSNNAFAVETFFVGQSHWDCTLKPNSFYQKLNNIIRYFQNNTTNLIGDSAWCFLKFSWLLCAMNIWLCNSIFNEYVTLMSLNELRACLCLPKKCFFFRKLE